MQIWKHTSKQVWNYSSMQRQLKLENKDDQSLNGIKFSKKVEEISETFCMPIILLCTMFFQKSLHSQSPHLNQSIFFQHIIVFTVTTVNTDQFSFNKLLIQSHHNKKSVFLKVTTIENTFLQQLIAFTVNTISNPAVTLWILINSWAYWYCHVGLISW